MPFTDILQAVSFLKDVNGREVEGFVIKYHTGYRLKIKAEDYLKLHKLIFHTSSKDIWLALKEDRLESVYEAIPDEMFSWIQGIEDDLVLQYNTLMKNANYIAKTALRRYNTKEEIARYISLFPERGVSFLIVNGNKERAEALVWKMIKPKYEKFSDEN